MNEAYGWNRGAQTGQREADWIIGEARREQREKVSQP